MPVTATIVPKDKVMNQTPKPFICLEDGEQGCIDDLKKLKRGSVIRVFLIKELPDELLRQQLEEETYILIFYSLEKGVGGRPEYISARAIGDLPQSRVWDLKYLNRIDVIAGFNSMASDLIVKLVKVNESLKARIERTNKRFLSLLE